MSRMSAEDPIDVVIEDVNASGENNCPIQI